MVKQRLSDAETAKAITFIVKVEKADEKKIYNRLEVFDILQDWVFREKFDLIYSSGVFVYFRNLDTIIIT